MKRKGNPAVFRKRVKYSNKSSTRVLDRTSGIAPLVVRNAKAVKVRVPKKIKVSGPLKAKIMKIIEKKVETVNGSYTDNWAGKIWNPISRRQNIVTPPGVSNFHFTTNAFLNVASVLFNKKTVPNSALNTFAPLSDKSFDYKNIQIHVRDSYSYYTFKNGSQHVQEVTLCVCVPKKKGFTAEWIPDTPSAIKADGASETNSAGYYSAQGMWADGVARDFANGLLLEGYMPPVGNNSPPVLSTPSTEDMFRRPSESPTFNNMWKVEYIRIVLQPGQVCIHKIQGPKGVMIDSTKLWQNNLLLNVQPYTRCVFGIIYNQPNVLTDLNTSGVGDNGTAGRWADITNTVQAGYGMYVERTDHYSIKLPEQAGFTISSTTIGNQQTLNMRRPKCVNNNWFPAHPLPGEGRTPEVLDLTIMNPQQPVLPRVTA